MAHNNNYSNKQEYYQVQQERAALQERKSRQDPTMRNNFLEAVEHARLHHFWIYDRVQKIWYNPDELLEKDKREYIDYDKLLFDIDFKDPLKALQQAHQKLLAFAIRIVEYQRRQQK